MESAESLSRVRQRIAAIEARRASARGDRVPTGHAAIDRALGGGLARAHVHELFAPDPADAASGAGFAAMIARLMGKRVVWLREQAIERQGGMLHAPGLAEIGLDPARLILGVMPDAHAVLRAAADVARCAEASVTIVELWRDPRPLDLTASRRLALATERSGTTLILLRIAATPVPSAAQTRWLVAAGPSHALEAGAPGWPTFDIELTRQRGRAETGAWRVEWNRDRAMFQSPGEGEAGAAPPSGVVVPLSLHRPAGVGAPVERRRAG